MKMSPLFSLSAALVLGACPALAQGVTSGSTGMTTGAVGSNREIPKGPLLEQAPDSARWTVNIEYPEDSAKKSADGKPALAPQTASLPRKLSVEKTGTTMRITTTDLAGRVTDKWYLGDTQYTLFPGQKLWLESKGSPATNDPNFEQQPATGFSDFEWVSHSNYVGTISFGGRSCLAFVPGGAAAIGPTENGLDAKRIQEALAVQPLVALVDAESRLPYVLRNRGVVHTFTFASPPSAKLSIPAELVEMIKKGIEAQARSMVPIPRP